MAHPNVLPLMAAHPPLPGESSAAYVEVPLRYFLANGVPEKEAARLLCICAPAGQEEFFTRIGAAVATRTTPPPKLDERAQTAFIKKAQQLAPKYRTELLKP